MASVINSFQGDYRFLSNFYLRHFRFAHRRWSTAEHAYQAMKTLDIQKREIIASLQTPGQAKRAGQDLKLRPDWEAIKVPVMTSIVLAKFQQWEDLRSRLLLTAPGELVEGNSWGDTFWGVNNKTGEGQNMLGRILMYVREII